MRSINACPSANTASFSPDGSKIAVACGDGSAPVFDTSTGQKLTVISAINAGTVNSATFSPDGKSIVTAIEAQGTGSVQIWNAELANVSQPALYKIAEQRITSNLTPTERKEYLAGIG
jgi:WD40 repeat protein